MQPNINCTPMWLTSDLVEVKGLSLSAEVFSVSLLSCSQSSLNSKEGILSVVFRKSDTY